MYGPEVGRFLDMAFFDDIGRLLRSSNSLETHSVYANPKTVVVVSNRLSITEYEVFRIAYRQWFGVDATDKDLKKVFIRYIFENQLPHWVRHFCIKVVRLHESGKLEVQEFTGQRDRRAGMSKNILIA